MMLKSMNTNRVLVAMSGGVDSSVSAALLKEKGFEVIGITMQIWPSGKAFGGCCSTQAVEDAKRVAESLDIPHYVLNFRSLFEEKVIKNFCEEYRAGRTPNPCIKCNQHIKFNALLKKADEVDAHYVATGHYARIEKSNEIYKLLKGIDRKKDQAYVLYPMTQKNLSRTLMPLGYLTKEKVRKIARELKLKVAEREESQEICFVPDEDYGKFLKDYIPEAVHPGPILDKEGNILGMHGGIMFYTIGQRKGLGSFGEPKYVISIDKERNALIIGSKDETLGNELIAEDIKLPHLERLQERMKVTAKIRYNSPEAEALLKPIGKDKVHVKFKKSQKSITPGQAVVFYRGEEVIGGGIICKKL